MTLLDAITDAIKETEEIDGDVIVTGFVVMAEFLDESGEGRIFCDTLEGQRCHSTLGLLGYGTAVETQRAAQHVLGEDED